MRKPCSSVLVQPRPSQLTGHSHAGVKGCLVLWIWCKGLGFRGSGVPGARRSVVQPGGCVSPHQCQQGGITRLRRLLHATMVRACG